MIRLENVTKMYDAYSGVSGISLEVGEGETLALIGKSGSGKTTLIKMINRLMEPDSGRVFFGGTDIRFLKKELLRRKIGYVIQAIGLFPHMTIERNISTVPELLGWKQKDISERIDELLDLMGLPHAMKQKYPSELSGGQQQRVGIARALAGRPQALLMDEPFGALDPIIRKEIRSDFLGIDEYKSLTKIIVTHDVREAFQLGDKIALLEKGRLTRVDTPRQLLFGAAHHDAKHFLGEDMLDLKLSVAEVRDVLPYLELGPGTVNNDFAFSLDDRPFMTLFSEAHPSQVAAIFEGGELAGNTTVSQMRSAYLKFDAQNHSSGHD